MAEREGASKPAAQRPAADKPCFFLSNMPYHMSGDRIKAVLDEEDIAYVSVETLTMGLPARTKSAGMATVNFDSEEARDSALSKINMKVVDGRAIVASLHAFVEADEHGRPSTGSY